MLLAGTLRSLSEAVEYAKSHQQGLSCNLSVVENEGIDQQGVRLAEQCLGGLYAKVFDCIDLKVSAANLGFGSGHNSAVQELASDFHLVLNPDISLSRESLHIGLEYLQANLGVVLLAPSVTGKEGENLFPCKRYPAVFDLLLRGFAPARLKRSFVERLSRYEMRELAVSEGPVSGIEIASGCCMLIRRAALDQAGGFDERFFLYFEDFDLSLRLRSFGELVYLPSMQIVHYGGNTAKKGLRHIALFAQSAWKFYQRHGWRWL